MKKESYMAIFERVQRKKGAVKILRAGTKGISLVTGILYMACLFFSGYQYVSGMEKWQLTAGLLSVPAISFVVLSLFRKKFNAPRPYEVYGFQPLIAKDTKGKSFPSRHVFSIFVIASSCCFCCLPVGIFLIIMGVILAVLRVISGVHFPKDVIAGAIIGEVCGLFMIFFL